jgi:1-aminocyclopropane-1-carboxylate deaminase/D-cysteine desulfhydrase-like pyridoxal-dependent ACC family enzyme
MAEVLETKEVRQWRAKVTTFNFDVDAVGGTMTGLLRRAEELEEERVALGIDDMAVVEAASAQKLIDKAAELRGLAT